MIHTHTHTQYTYRNKALREEAMQDSPVEGSLKTNKLKDKQSH